MTHKPYVILYKCVAQTDLLADKTGVQTRRGRGCVSPEVSQQRLLGQYSSQQKNHHFMQCFFMINIYICILILIYFIL